MSQPRVLALYPVCLLAGHVCFSCSARNQRLHSHLRSWVSDVRGLDCCRLGMGPAGGQCCRAPDALPAPPRCIPRATEAWPVSVAAVEAVYSKSALATSDVSALSAAQRYAPALFQFRLAARPAPANQMCGPQMQFVPDLPSATATTEFCPLCIWVLSIGHCQLPGRRVRPLLIFRVSPMLGKGLRVARQRSPPRRLWP